MKSILVTLSLLISTSVFGKSKDVLPKHGGIYRNTVSLKVGKTAVSIRGIDIEKGMNIGFQGDLYFRLAHWARLRTSFYGQTFMLAVVRKKVTETAARLDKSLDFLFKILSNDVVLLEVFVAANYLLDFREINYQGTEVISVKNLAGPGTGVNLESKYVDGQVRFNVLFGKESSDFRTHSSIFAWQAAFRILLRYWRLEIPISLNLVSYNVKYAKRPEDMLSVKIKPTYMASQYMGFYLAFEYNCYYSEEPGLLETTAGMGVRIRW